MGIGRRDRREDAFVILRTLARSRSGEQTFRDGLTTCFPGWGGEPLFDWAFRRVAAGRMPDLLVAEVDSRLAGGCALIYRTVRSSSGQTQPVAILAGAWTLPEWRRAGIFSSLVQFAKEIAAETSVGCLAAFVRVDNASARRLAAAGAQLIPSFYCRSGKGAELAPEWADAAPFRTDRAGSTFFYTPAEFDAQFLARPKTVTAIEGRGWRALVEDGDALLLVEATTRDAFAAAAVAAAHRAAGRGRALNCFTTVPARRDALLASGFSVSRGALAVISPDRWRHWNLEGGDRM